MCCVNSLVLGERRHVWLWLCNIILCYSVMNIFVASFVFLHLTGTVCTVRSSAGEEVLFGSNFTISCIFNKNCTKEIFRNNKLIAFKPSSSVVSVENITELSTFACKCKDTQDLCGIDITPGCKLESFYYMWSVLSNLNDRLWPER